MYVPGIWECNFYWVCNRSNMGYTCKSTYHIAGKFGRELNLAVWRSAYATAKLKSTNISYSHIYIWRSRTEPPNLIFLQWQFWAQPPNLIPANISACLYECRSNVHWCARYSGAWAFLPWAKSYDLGQVSHQPTHLVLIKQDAA